ncbi:MAG: YceI family protein [Acidimicrobiales bacterium]
MARFAISPERSSVWIDARSSLHPVHSESKGLEGFFEAEVQGGGHLDLTVAPRAHLEMPVRLLSSGNALYDREMQRRIEARRFPAITGELSEMKDSGGDGRYAVRGDVTFKGVTRSFEDDMTLSTPDEATLCLEGEHVFDIRDFGMEPPKIMMLKVYPDVSVRVRIVAEAKR